MKTKLLTAALFCALGLNLSAFEMGYKTFDNGTIKKSDELKGLEKFDKGHYKTLINMEAMPPGLKFTVSNDRELIGAMGKQTVESFTREQLTTVRSPSGALIPCFVVSGKGFLPGEKVKMKFECEDGQISTVDIIPYPIHDCNEKGDAFVCAELKKTKPYAYNIIANGFEDGEELELNTVAGKATETVKVTYQRGKPIPYLPNIKKGQRGTSHLAIKRQNGDVFDLDLPWGYELSKYAKGKIKP